MENAELTRVMFALKYANRLQVNKKTGEVHMHLVPGVYSKILTHLGGDYVFKDRLYTNEHTGEMMLNLDYKPKVKPQVADSVKPVTESSTKPPVRRVFKRPYYPRFKRKINVY